MEANIIRSLCLSVQLYNFNNFANISRAWLAHHALRFPGWFRSFLSTYEKNF